MRRNNDLPELWGGVECTINRVGERYHDQLARSLHLNRPRDLELFAALGLKALRFPVLWEHVHAGPDANFSLLDPMLKRTRALGMRVIAGLCHHGSGPRSTNLLDPMFEFGLAAHALRVAQRYPWITAYTPINEPVTTARFSALYGYWYPHARDTASFFRAVVHQCRATIRAMLEIRRVQPQARLIQTEDIPTIRSTPALAYQAEYENTRRFLAFDLLFGHVNRDHPMYGHLCANGIAERELQWILEHACPPDIIGANYYLTSDRYLDENLELYPPRTHGGNGRQAYADADAVRVPGVGLVGHAHVLRTLWNRYQTPLVLTEVHAGCTREEQLRWLHEAWSAACEVRFEGADVRALTAWSLLGSFDWNSLVCIAAGKYEPGLFDLRAPDPQRTCLADMVQALAEAGEYEHPVLASTGWWRRASSTTQASSKTARPILITGARGRLARCFVQACEGRGLRYVALTREELDIADADEVQQALRRLRPWAVVNAAGFCRFHAEDGGELLRYHRDNVVGPATLATQCGLHSARLLTFSSPWVYDGSLPRPYLEHDPASPTTHYGASQLAAEQLILAKDCNALIVRTGPLFGWDADRDTLLSRLRNLAAGRRVCCSFEAIASPSYAPDVVDASLDALIDGIRGIRHIVNLGRASDAELLRRTARALGIDATRLEESVPLCVACGGWPEFRVLGTEHAESMPQLEDAIERFASRHRAAFEELRISRGL